MEAQTNMFHAGLDIPENVLLVHFLPMIPSTCYINVDLFLSTYNSDTLSYNEFSF